MATKVAINGFGRIGRLVARAILSRTDHGLELVAINVSVEGDTLIIDGKRIKVTAERDPANLPHAALGVEVALECTGIFADKAKASAHLTAGAKRVVISAPATGVDKTIVFGVNHDKLTKDDIVISNASCTTNCLAPLAKVLHEAIGIESGFMTTIHSYTNDQNTLDQIHKDMRRARAAAVSMIPTTTGAARAVGEVLPELKGKLDGSSVRVPTPNVSVVDLKIIAKRSTTVEEVNGLLKAAAEAGPLKDVLGYSDEPLVSIDYNGDPRSSTVDSLETAVIDGKLVRVLSWYDNEWGFSNRMIDTTKLVVSLL
jgi:glyceraldehyde 3-phosphate dehydrogenase